MRRSLLNGWETPVVDLLLSAFVVEVDEFDGHEVAEVGDVRVVEGDVPVLSDPHDDDVDRPLRQNRRVATEQKLDAVPSIFRIEVVNRLKWKLAETMLPQIPRESRGGARREPDILVHMESDDLSPVDVFSGAEGLERLVLRRGGGKDDSGFSLLVNRLGDRFRRVATRASA